MLERKPHHQRLDGRSKDQRKIRRGEPAPSPLIVRMMPSPHERLSLGGVVQKEDQRPFQDCHRSLLRFSRCGIGGPFAKSPI